MKYKLAIQSISYKCVSICILSSESSELNECIQEVKQIAYNSLIREKLVYIKEYDIGHMSSTSSKKRKVYVKN